MEVLATLSIGTYKGCFGRNILLQLCHTSRDFSVCGEEGQDLEQWGVGVCDFFLRLYEIRLYTLTRKIWHD
jgi:hypothetical protein